MIIALSIVTALLLIFSALCVLYILGSANTLSTWTNHKGMFWITEFSKIKVIYCTGNEFIELYKNDKFTILTTCTDREDYQKNKHIFNAEIKYLKGIDEEGYLIIQLWNTRKLNKIYGVENRK